MLNFVTLVSVVVMSAHPARPTVIMPSHAVAQGHTRECTERAYGRMCAPPLSDFDFAMSDVSFKLTRRFTEYSGDISGRLLSALMSSGPAIGQDSAMIVQMLSAMGQYQKTDGHFGAEQDLKAGIKPERDMPILWGNSRLLLAFTQRYEQTKDAEVLRVVRGIGDYVISTRPYLGKPENLSLGGAYAVGYTTCYPSLIEGMARLTEVSGDPKYLDEARNIARIALGDTSFEHHHSHGRLASYRGMLEIDRISASSEFLPAVKAGVAKVTSDFMLPTGGVTEIFDRTDLRDEGCSEVDWIMVNLLLWRATGETAYLDTADYTLRNHLLATQFMNGGFGHHMLRFLTQGGKIWPGGGIANIGAEAYWCCAEHGTQLLGDVTRWGVVGDGQAARVTFLAEVRSKVTIASRAVTVTATEPKPGSWQVEVTAEGSAPVELDLRVPHGHNGLAIDSEWVQESKSWMRRTVQPGSKLHVQFADRIRLAAPFDSHAAAEGSPQRVLVGEDLYCLPDAFVPDGFVPVDVVPTIHIAADKSTNGEIPVVVRGGTGGRDRVRTKLVPMLHRPPGGCLCLFDVKPAGPGQIESAASYTRKGVPVEFLFACDGKTEIFFNGKSVGKTQGWGETGRTEIYVDRGPLIVAIKATSKAAKPGLIGRIHVNGHTWVTDAKNWSVVRCPTTLPADWLRDDSAGAREQIKLMDLGPIGIEPWKYIPAEYTGVPARWIWPETNGGSADRSWLFRCRLNID